MKEFMKKLLNWRKSEPLVHAGKLMHFAPKHDGIYTYFRYDDERSIMVILNKGDDRELSLEPYKERLSSFSKAVDVIDGQEFILNKPLRIESKKAYILELRRDGN